MVVDLGRDTTQPSTDTSTAPILLNTHYVLELSISWCKTARWLKSEQSIKSSLLSTYCIQGSGWTVRETVFASRRILSGHTNLLNVFLAPFPLLSDAIHPPVSPCCLSLKIICASNPGVFPVPRTGNTSPSYIDEMLQGSAGQLLLIGPAHRPRRPSASLLSCERACRWAGLGP